jgi:hypothetical protein
MMEQEEIKTGGEYTLKEYQVEDSSDTSDMDEKYESENEQDLYDEFWRQNQKSDRMLELEKQHKEESDIQEALLKSGDYVLLKHGGSCTDGILQLSAKGGKAYKQNIANGDAKDVAFWRVLRTMRRNGFNCYDEAPYVAMIKRPYERWIKIKKEISPAPYSDISVEWQFIFKKEKCLNDLTLELLERKDSISKEDFVNLKREVDGVEIVWC